MQKILRSCIGLSAVAAVAVLATGCGSKPAEDTSASTAPAPTTSGGGYPGNSRYPSAGGRPMGGSPAAGTGAANDPNAALNNPNVPESVKAQIRATQGRR